MGSDYLRSAFLGLLFDRFEIDLHARGYLDFTDTGTQFSDLATVKRVVGDVKFTAKKGRSLAQSPTEFPYAIRGCRGSMHTSFGLQYVFYHRR